MLTSTLASLPWSSSAAVEVMTWNHGRWHDLHYQVAMDFFTARGLGRGPIGVAVQDFKDLETTTVAQL